MWGAGRGGCSTPLGGEGHGRSPASQTLLAAAALLLLASLSSKLTTEAPSRTALAVRSLLHLPSGAHAVASAGRPETTGGEPTAALLLEQQSSVEVGA